MPTTTAPLPPLRPKSSRIETLPTGIVELVATHPTPESLRSIHAVSRTIFDKTLDVYGARFFGQITVCLHPYSLQMLTGVSNARYLAKHARRVVVGTESFGLVDPVHELAAKRNEASYNKTDTPMLNPSLLDQVRQRMDLLTLAQAFARLPRLRNVFLGYKLDGKHTLRPTWDKKIIIHSDCVLDHCRIPHVDSFGKPTTTSERISTVMGMKLEQVDLGKVGLTMALRSIDLFEGNYTKPRVWCKIKAFTQRLEALSLWFPSVSTHQRETQSLQALEAILSGASIRYVLVRSSYGLLHEAPDPDVGITAFKLLSASQHQYLTALDLNLIRMRYSQMCAGLKLFSKHLRVLMIQRCHITGLRTGKVHQPGTWTTSLKEIRTIRDVVCLYLSNLSQEKQLPLQRRWLSPGMERRSKQACWRGWLNIKIALHLLSGASNLQDPAFPNNLADQTIGDNFWLNLGYADHHVRKNRPEGITFAQWLRSWGKSLVNINSSRGTKRDPDTEAE
ncbi:hypothetical protein E8E11_000699 [Didymella keratinophila]|nr:hypothetical protein E8E11_000699 [Didymella keratinophila]